MKLILDYSMIGAILEDIVMEDYIYTTMLKIIDYTGNFTLLDNLKLCPKIQFSEKKCEFEFSCQKLINLL